MPRTIVDIDGNEIEVPTDEEVTALKKEAEEAALLRKQAEDLQQELEKEKNPDFAAMRQGAKKRERLEEEARKLGFEVMSDGTLVNKNETQVKPQDVQQMAQQMARKAIVEDFVAGELSYIPDDKRNDVQEMYNTLTQGKELTKAEAEKYIGYAVNAVSPDLGYSRTRRASAAPLGREPRFEDNQGGVSEVAKEMARDFRVSEKDLGRKGDVSDLLLSK